MGDIASVLGNQMLVIAVGWQIYDITNSAMSLGLVGLAHFGAQFLFTLSAGHAADHYDRRQVAMICQAVQCAAAKKTAVIVGPALGGLMYLWGASAVYLSSAVFIKREVLAVGKA